MGHQNPCVSQPIVQRVHCASDELIRIGLALFGACCNHLGYGFVGGAGSFRKSDGDRVPQLQQSFWLGVPRVCSACALGLGQQPHFGGRSWAAMN